MSDLLPARRLGVSMRVAEAETYAETRDALAWDWGRFLQAALPEVLWMPLPNLGADAPSFVDRWGIDGLILSGGNDLGQAERRDRTELELLRHFRSTRRPVFAVCRGLQLLHRHHGGDIRPCDPGAHAGTRHEVHFVHDLPAMPLAGRRAQVNSYHTFGVRGDELRSPLTPFAVTEDGWVEGVIETDRPVVAVMWHPEREDPIRDLDRQLVRRAFAYDIAAS